MAPGINLLPGCVVELRDLRHRRPAHANRTHDRQLLVVTPITAPLAPPQISPRIIHPRTRDVVCDIAMQMS
jgi:hypothetical protein